MALDTLSSREQLLATTAELMTETGSVEVSLSDIAARSGLNSALVKYYFGGKSGLLVELATDVLGRAVGQLEELMQMDLDPVEKLKLHIKGVITVYFRYPFVNRLLHTLFMQPDTAQQVAQTISVPLAKAQRQILEQAEQQGLIRPIDPMMFYFIVLGACDHLFFGQNVLKYAFNVERVDDDLRRQYTDTLLDLVLRGLLIEKDGATTAVTVKSGRA